jgi:hypothetical protein
VVSLSLLSVVVSDVLVSEVVAVPGAESLQASPATHNKNDARRVSVRLTP